MLSHEFVYPRVVPIPSRTTDDPRTPQGPPASRQRDLVMESLLRCPGATPGRAGTRA
jgi:hypothetical protein